MSSLQPILPKQASRVAWHGIKTSRPRAFLTLVYTELHLTLLSTPPTTTMSSYPPTEPPAAYHQSGDAPEYGQHEKGFTEGKVGDHQPATGEYDVQEASTNPLHRDLKSRHMQMIAIGMPSFIL